jgi:hypothetical protein
LRSTRSRMRSILLEGKCAIVEVAAYSHLLNSKLILPSLPIVPLLDAAVRAGKHSGS